MVGSVRSIFDCVRFIVVAGFVLGSSRSIFDGVRLSLLVSGLGRSGFEGVFLRRHADGWLATESIFLN